MLCSGIIAAVNAHIYVVIHCPMPAQRMKVVSVNVCYSPPPTKTLFGYYSNVPSATAKQMSD